MAETDYRKLCLELFGTDDEKQLAEIAGRLLQKNPRNAGRKKKFTPEQVREMRDLRRQGFTVKEIAEKFGTSRQMIGRYLNSYYPLGVSKDQEETS